MTYTKEEIIVLAAIVWKYGDIYIDEKTEIEHHIIGIPYSEFMNFALEKFEVAHDDKEGITYFKVQKTT